jgi:hypothetical protein
MGLAIGTIAQHQPTAGPNQLSGGVEPRFIAVSHTAWKLEVDMTETKTSCPKSVSDTARILVGLGTFSSLYSLPVMLIGLFIGPHILVPGIVFLLVGPACFFLGRGLAKGRPWAWYGSLVLTVCIFFAMGLMAYEEMRDLRGASWALVFPGAVGFLAVFGFLSLLRRDARDWFGSLQFRLKTLAIVILSIRLSLGLVKACVNWIQMDQATPQVIPDHRKWPGGPRDLDHRSIPPYLGAVHRTRWAS